MNVYSRLNINFNKFKVLNAHFNCTFVSHVLGTAKARGRVEPSLATCVPGNKTNLRKRQRLCRWVVQ